jgi:hypothetical protein
MFAIVFIMYVSAGVQCVSLMSVMSSLQVATRPTSVPPAFDDQLVAMQDMLGMLDRDSPPIVKPSLGNDQGPSQAPTVTLPAPLPGFQYIMWPVWAAPPIHPSRPPEAGARVPVLANHPPKPVSDSDTKREGEINRCVQLFLIRRDVWFSVFHLQFRRVPICISLCAMPCMYISVCCVFAMCVCTPISLRSPFTRTDTGKPNLDDVGSAQAEPDIRTTTAPNLGPPPGHAVTHEPGATNAASMDTTMSICVANMAKGLPTTTSVGQSAEAQSLSVTDPPHVVESQSFPPEAPAMQQVSALDVVNDTDSEQDEERMRRNGGGSNGPPPQLPAEGAHGNVSCGAGAECKIGLPVQRDGAHACDICRCRMHSFCGRGIGEEGHGQARRCPPCQRLRRELFPSTAKGT